MYVCGNISNFKQHYSCRIAQIPPREITAALSSVDSLYAKVVSYAQYHDEKSNPNETKAITISEILIDGMPPSLVMFQCLVP